MDILYIIMKVSDMLRERARAAIGAVRRAPRYRPQVSAPIIGGPRTCPSAARKRRGAPQNQRPPAPFPPCHAPPPALIFPVPFRPRRFSPLAVSTGVGRVCLYVFIS